MGTIIVLKVNTSEQVNTLLLQKVCKHDCNEGIFTDPQMSASLYVFSLLFKNLAVFNTTFNIDMLNYIVNSVVWLVKIKFMLICIHHFSALVIEELHGKTA